MLLVLFIPLLSCSPKAENEMPQVPKEEGMKQVDFQKSEDPQGLDRTSFSIEETDARKFLDSYEKTLHDEGWVTKDDNKPVSITLSKDSRIIIVVAKPIEGSDEFEVIVFSK
jgi:hypothetical protein